MANNTPLTGGSNPNSSNIVSVTANTSNSTASRSIPSAPYPPNANSQQRYPSRSSLRSSPNYSSLTNVTAEMTSTSGMTNNNSSSWGESDIMTSSRTSSSHPWKTSTTSATSNNNNNIRSPLRPQVRFCHPHMIASINTLTHSNTTAASTKEGTLHSSDPLLLEITQLRHDRRTHTLQRAVVAQSRHSNPSKSSSAASSSSSSMVITHHNSMMASTCMDVANTMIGSSSAVHTNTMAPIATGLTNGALCIHTVATDDANHHADDDDHDDDDRMMFSVNRHYWMTPRTSNHNHRPVTAVAWKPHASWVAVGWNAQSTGTNTTTGGGANSTISSNNANNTTVGQPLDHAAHTTNPNHHPHMHSPTSAGEPASMSPSSATVPSGGGGDVRGSSVTGGKKAVASGRMSEKEYGCFVWDVQHQVTNNRGTTITKNTTKPLFKLSHQMGVASLAWLHPSTLIVGGQLRNAHLYDLRAQSSSSSAAVATVYAHNFSVSGIATDPQRSHRFATFCSMANEPVKIWDARRTDTFVQEIKIGSGSFAKSDDPQACYASTVQWSTRESGILSVAVANSIYDFDTSTSNSRPIGVGSYDMGQSIHNFCLYPYKSFDEKSKLEDWISSLYSRRAIVVPEDRTVQDLAKHRISPVAVSSRDGIIAHSLGRTLWVGEERSGHMAMDSAQIHSEEDISAKMKRRAGCLHTVKYSMDTSSNIKMLAEDGIMAQNQTSSVSTTRDGLLRLWVWIERIEEFCSDGEEAINSGLLLWPVKGLLDAGTLRLLTIGGQQRSGETEDYCEALACPIYDSPGRRAALAACGWTGKFDLINIMGECEELDEFERSAALAVWHGDIGSAVNALQRGASSIRTSAEKKEHHDDKSKTSRYAETLELVSLCIAGYRGGSGNSPSSVWRQACANLMERNDLSGVNRSSSRAAYLSALLRFLMAPDIETAHKEILSDDLVSLSDRIGFACKFLPKAELEKTLLQFVAECRNHGNVEGLLITGIEKKGIKILQSYMDHHSDVQTAALVTSRVIFPSTWVNERRICNEWLDTYRTLLNTWQMWQSRAVFDVDRAKLLRKLKGRQQSEGSKNKKRLTHDNSDVQAPVPASLMVRCNFCNSPLLTKTQDGASMEKLSKMKSVLSCCPTCRKPLPRCAVCMLSLGTTNPYHELVRRMTGAEESSSSNLPFAEWFAWCMRCKHGGHAHHMVGWFANHETCPVSGCGCRCQFDGVQKLRRPSKPSS